MTWDTTTGVNFLRTNNFLKKIICSIKLFLLLASNLSFVYYFFIVWLVIIAHLLFQKPFTCYVANCDKAYTSKSHLDRHVNSAHKESELDILYWYVNMSIKITGIDLFLVHRSKLQISYNAQRIGFIQYEPCHIFQLPTLYEKIL